jgi:hypothetical protein
MKPTFTDILKAKGDQKAGHKYKSRKPDGKGGWLYDYGKGKPDAPDGPRQPWSHQEQAATDKQDWANAAQELLDANTGKTQDDFHYRAMMRAWVSGDMGQTAHLRNTFKGSKRADEDLVERVGQGSRAKPLVQTDRIFSGGSMPPADPGNYWGKSLTTKKEGTMKPTFSQLLKANGKHGEYSDDGPKHEGKSCKQAHPDVDHKAWAASQKKAKEEDGSEPAEKSLRVDSWSSLVKAKGDQKAGHKYKSRKPDGKGGWDYDYGDGKGFRKKGEEDGGKAEAKSDDKPEGRHKVKDTEGLSEGVKERLASYNLEVVEDAGSTPELAIEIAERLEAGISESADVCKQSPPVCAGNMGIPRADMPQIMDDPIKDLLAATKKDGTPDEGKRKKGQAAVDAGADPDSDKTPFDMMLDHFKAGGISVSEPTPIKVGELKATQKDIQAAKTNQFAEFQMKGEFPNGAKADFSKDPIVMSSDGHILDGHHRYAALLMLGPDMEMNAITIDLPMHELLEKSFETPGAGVFRMDLKNNVVTGPTPDYKEYKRKADAKLQSATVSSQGDRISKLEGSGEDAKTKKSLPLFGSIIKAYRPTA